MRVHASRFATRFAVTLLACLLAAGHASASVKQDVDLTMEDATGMQAVIVQEWSDEDAKEFRRSLDVLFGDDDGALNASEIDRIVSATKKDMQDATLPLVRVDNVTARVTHVAVALDGAEGDVNASASVTLKHEVTLAFPDAESAREHTVRVTPLRGGFLSLMAPAGWEIVESENLGTPQNAAGMIGGQYDGEKPVTVTLRDPSVPAPAPSDDGTTASTDGTGDGNADGGTDAPAPTDGENADDAPNGNPAGAFAHALRGLATSIIALGEAVAAPLPAWARGLFVAGFLGMAAGGGAWLVARRGWDDSQD